MNGGEGVVEGGWDSTGHSSLFTRGSAGPSLPFVHSGAGPSSISIVGVLLSS